MEALLISNDCVVSLKNFMYFTWIVEHTEALGLEF